MIDTMVMPSTWPVGRPWQVLCPQPQGEMRAFRWLAYSGFRPYVPLERKSVAQNFNRRRDVVRPIFPGYVFVQHDPIRDLRGQLDRCPVTMRLWKTAGIPIFLNDGHIAALRQAEDRLNNPPPPPPPPKLKPGDRVEIIVDDVWAKHLALVDKLDANGKVCLLLDLFGRLTSLRVSANQVRLV